MAPPDGGHHKVSSLCVLVLVLCICGGHPAAWNTVDDRSMSGRGLMGDSLDEPMELPLGELMEESKKTPMNKLKESLVEELNEQTRITFGDEEATDGNGGTTTNGTERDGVQDLTPEEGSELFRHPSYLTKHERSVPDVSAVPHPPEVPNDSPDDTTSVMEPHMMEGYKNYHPLPTLPSVYEVVVRVEHVSEHDGYEMRERERAGRAHHTLTAPAFTMACMFDTSTGDGYTVKGVKCGRKSNLPRACFCDDRGERVVLSPDLVMPGASYSCLPYVALRSLVTFLNNTNATMYTERIGGVEAWSWQVITHNISVEAVYTSSNPGTGSPVQPRPLVPLFFSVKTKGAVPGLTDGATWLKYRVLSWRPTTESVMELMSTPPGVFCPAHERKFLPKLANQFTLTMETVVENLESIAYEHQSYDAEEKLVSYMYRPHLHHEGALFLHNMPVLAGPDAMQTYRVVHDFRTGIQYRIEEQSSNCTVEAIPVTALDAVATDGKTIRLRHASELISLHPKHFLYKGTRTIRGILCDVWVADRGTRKGQYSTVEIFFTHENWTIEIEVFNKISQIPIGISSYVANDDNPNVWSSKVHTFFYEYNDSHPSWDKFDISPCLNRINRIFLLFTLEVAYSELVHYNLETAKNSIRRAAAGIAGVSPLRITDLFLRSRHSTGEVDVWFVLLEKPRVEGPVLNPRPQLMMAEAYKLLHDITRKHNVSIKLDLSPNKKLFVTIKRGSLETTTGALHPNMRHKSRRYIQAGYTSGSMAGLGFSMAILGTCVGILIGFLLWKRSSGVPYQVTD